MGSLAKASGLAAVLSCSLFAGAWLGGCSRDEAKAPAERVAVLQAGLESAFVAPDDTVAVIVNFHEPRTQRPLIASRRAAIRQLQTEMMTKNARGFSVTRRFNHVPAIAGRLTKDALDALRRDPNVAYIQFDSRGGGALKEAVPAIGADKVQSVHKLTGHGVTVAVLDTGIVTTHPDLSDSLVAQHCFTQADCPPFRLTEGTSAEDDHGHGSNVSGIITSDGVVSSVGFAPGADVVAVKIDDQNDSGQESDWVSGLDWIYDNLSTLHVKVVNMSICTIALYADAAQCDQQEPALAKAVKNLVDAGVVVFAASGNTGSISAMSAPACNTGVIAVGAVYDSNVGHQPPTEASYRVRGGLAFADCGDDTTAFDQITCFTNAPARLDLVAPGAPMLSDSLNGKTETYWGTSQASPSAAGVAALMLECNPNLTPAEIKKAMIETGVPNMDPRSGRMFPSLRALAAVEAVCFKDDAGVPMPDAGVVTAIDAGTGAAGVTGQAGTSVGTGGAPTATGSGGFDLGSGGQAAGSAGLSVTAAGGAGGASGAGGAAQMIDTPIAQREQSSCSCGVLGASRDRSAAPRIPGPATAFAFGLGLASWRRRRRVR